MIGYAWATISHINRPTGDEPRLKKKMTHSLIIYVCVDT